MNTHWKTWVLQKGYTLAGFGALPLIGLRLLWKARTMPDYLSHLDERIGRMPPCAGPLIWIHAVSVGETRAVAPLVSALLQACPDHRLLLTAMTPTGRATACALFKDEPRVQVAYLPWDFPFAVQRFLKQTHPVLGIIMETEWWPNLMQAAQRQGCPIALVNARLSPRSARGYGRVRSLVGPLLRSFCAIGAQTPQDAERLRALGAHTSTVTGNLKFDTPVPLALRAQGLQWKAALAGRPVWVLASSREDEEADFMHALLAHPPPAGGHPAPLWVVVPRHPQRFETVRDRLAHAGFSVKQRSLGLPEPDTAVWLGDSMGELYAYYAMADVAVIGGSWRPLGGQNPIEACAVGTPVVFGPHTFNFTHVCESACAEGAALRAQNPTEALAAVWPLMTDPIKANAMKTRALAFAQRHQGATQKTLALLTPWLDTRH